MGHPAHIVINVIISLVGLLLCLGCATPPSSKLVIPAIPPPKTVGSLWQEENGRAYLYEDLRAMRVGDIITINIQEQQKGSKSADTTAQRESTLTNSINGERPARSEFQVFGWARVYNAHWGSMPVQIINLPARERRIARIR